MNKKEAVLISAYTGYLLTNEFYEVHKFCEELLNRPVFSHEFASEKLQKEIQEKCRPMIIELIENEVDVDIIDQLKAEIEGLSIAREISQKHIAKLNKELERANATNERIKEIWQQK